MPPRTVDDIADASGHAIKIGHGIEVDVYVGAEQVFDWVEDYIDIRDDGCHERQVGDRVEGEVGIASLIRRAAEKAASTAAADAGQAIEEGTGRAAETVDDVAHGSGHAIKIGHGIEVDIDISAEKILDRVEVHIDIRDDGWDERQVGNRAEGEVGIASLIRRAAEKAAAAATADACQAIEQGTGRATETADDIADASGHAIKIGHGIEVDIDISAEKDPRPGRGSHRHPR